MQSRRFFLPRALPNAPPPAELKRRSKDLYRLFRHRDDRQSVDCPSADATTARELSIVLDHRGRGETRRKRAFTEHPSGWKRIAGNALPADNCNLLNRREGTALPCDALAFTDVC